MSGLTRYGDFWGRTPQTAGNIYWVAPGDSYTIAGAQGSRSFSASNGNDGLDPRRALRTIDRAWNLVAADAGDVIMLLPGTHTVSTSSVAADVAGVGMFGLPGGRGNWVREKTILTTDITGDEIINVSAANIEMGHFTLRPITASDALDLTADADGFYMHDFSIDMATPAVSTSTVGLTLAAANNILLENFYVECDGAQGNAIVATAALDSLIKGGRFVQSAGTWASAVLCGAATDRLLFDDCHFYASNAAVMTSAITGTGATIASGVRVLPNCTFGDRVRTAFSGFDAGEVEGHVLLDHPPRMRYLRNAITFAAGTTGSVATHETFTVTGTVRIRLLNEVTANLAGATATISYGEATAGTSIIAATTGTDLVAGELWYDATPTTSADAFGTAVFDRVVTNGTDIGYAVATAALSAGTMVFHCWWEPLSEDGLVVSADGTGTL